MTSIQIGKWLWGTTLNVIMPPLCLSCGGQVAEARNLCGSCWSQLSFIEEPRCPLWGEPFAFDAGSGTLSGRALATPADWTSLTAAVNFNDQAQRIVHALKYHDRLETATLMARLMFRALRAQLAGDPLLVPVPLHWLRLWRRRYNQAALLAQSLAMLGRAPYAAHVLVRHRRTPSQVGLDRQKRVTNLKGAFAVSQAARAQIAGRRILLVDDVLTTGATAAEASRCLLESGASAVDVVVFALVLQPGQSHM
jgi:ComF family protein